MKVPQFGYLTPESIEHRRRDQTPPSAVHVTELDATGEPDPAETGVFAASWRAAAALRAEIEGGA